MFLENLVFDAGDPQRTGRFWEELVDGERLTDDTGIYETRLDLGDWYLDLCFQQVPEPATEPPRLHLELAEGPAGTERADPEGNPVGVAPDGRPETGPIAGLTLDSADPARDAEFWAWLTGWRAEADDATTLRHPSGRGPVLRFHPEPAPKGRAKNRVHLDLRLEPGDDDADAVEAAILARGGRPLGADWGDLPWRSYLDPSGNEFCVLPARSS